MSLAAQHRRPGPRLWPAVLIPALAGILLLLVWGLGGDLHRQGKIEKTYAVVGLSLVALTAWLVFFSRTRWKTRLMLVAAVTLIGALAAATLRVRGFSGDVVPIVEWRWSAVMPRAASDAAAPYDTAGAGFPQFLGPLRDGRVPDVRLDPDWGLHPPELVWRRPIGSGWSGFAIVGSRAVTQEQQGEEERVSCYELTSGAPLWSHADPVRFENAVSGVGPRATPTIVEGRVYTLGATGILNALDLDTGARIWSVDVARDSDTGPPEYGYSGSPLVFDGLVVVHSGGPSGRALVAYDARSGERRWDGGSAGEAYSSPLLAELARQRQVLIFGDGGLEGVAAVDGESLWSRPWPGGTQKVSQPLLLPGDRVFVSSGYGVGAELLAIETDAGGRLAPQQVWKSMAMKAKFTNVVHREGFLYGLDDGILACVDVSEGRRQWKGGRYGHGQVLLVDDLLLVQTERGDVVLVAATPTAHRELGRVRALSAKTWNHPALAAPYLLVRNDREAACLRLPLASGSPP